MNINFCISSQILEIRKPEANAQITNTYEKLASIQSQFLNVDKRYDHLL